MLTGIVVGSGPGWVLTGAGVSGIGVGRTGVPAAVGPGSRGGSGFCGVEDGDSVLLDGVSVGPTGGVGLPGVPGVLGVDGVEGDLAVSVKAGPASGVSDVGGFGLTGADGPQRTNQAPSPTALF